MYNSNDTMNFPLLSTLPITYVISFWSSKHDGITWCHIHAALRTQYILLPATSCPYCSFNCIKRASHPFSYTIYPTTISWKTNLQLQPCVAVLCAFDQQEKKYSYVLLIPTGYRKWSYLFILWYHLVFCPPQRRPKFTSFSSYYSLPKQ